MTRMWLLLATLGACDHDEAWCTKYSNSAQFCSAGLETCHEYRALANADVPLPGPCDPWTTCPQQVWTECEPTQLHWCYAVRDEWNWATYDLPSVRCYQLREDCENWNREEQGDGECLEY